MLARSRAVCLAGLALAALARPAHATVGGDASLTVLGYAPADGALYVVTHAGGEADPRPQLHRFSLRSDRPEQPRRARSWDADPADAIPEGTGAAATLRFCHVRTDRGGSTETASPVLTLAGGVTRWAPAPEPTSGPCR